MRAPPIDGHRRAEPVRRKPSAGGSATADFSRHLLAAAGDGVAAASAPDSLADLAALLGVQEVEVDHRAPREQARRHGEDLLDRLETLHLELLGGRVSVDRLAQLAAVLGEDRPPSGDDRLDALVGEIRLRAEVELAKLGKSA